MSDFFFAIVYISIMKLRNKILGESKLIYPPKSQKPNFKDFPHSWEGILSQFLRVLSVSCKNASFSELRHPILFSEKLGIPSWTEVCTVFRKKESVYGALRTKRPKLIVYSTEKSCLFLLRKRREILEKSTLWIGWIGQFDSPKFLFLSFIMDV